MSASLFIKNSVAKFFKHYRINISFKCLNSSITKNPSVVTAGVIIIGDEILNGQAEDTNTSFLIKNLNCSGIKVNKIVIVPDDIDVIAQEVSSFSSSCTVVLTSGGIGPTHDDITYEAVAKALKEELVLSEELCNIFTDHFGPQAKQNPAIKKFSSIPKSAVLNFKANGQKSKFPLVSVKNIFMLPGVPTILQKSFKVFKSNFRLYNKPNLTDTIYLASDEFLITPILNEAVNLFKDHVKFGSYPSFTDNYYRVKITMESLDDEKIREAKEFFVKQIPKDKIVDYKIKLLESSVNEVSTLCYENPSFSLATNIIEQALKTYDLSEMCICFNGGKDCTALLHLLYSKVQKMKPLDWTKLHALYVRNGITFPEIEEFILNSINNYNLTLSTIEGDLKTSFSQFLQSHPQIKAVLMGTRRCDPGAESLRYFNPTDEGWPPIMRVLPILDWSYSDVWNFIRQLQLPYCVLYDRGYTSIGLKRQTVKNSALLISDESRHPSYKPAYMLNDDDEERNGRL